jgi:triphosphoribosyl-dephospho-CoA synthase
LRDSDLEAAVIAACTAETLAPKPGNVGPNAAFDDLDPFDLIRAGSAIAPILAEATGQPIGQTILRAVQASTNQTTSNANLGIILLLAPLAAAADRHVISPASVERVLTQTSVDDAEFAYRAIRLAKPGGMGQVSDQDIHSKPTATLRQAMQLAADRDSIAACYANNFADIFDLGEPTLQNARAFGANLLEAVVWCHLRWMAHVPDSLITRKNGRDVGLYVQSRARTVIDGWTDPHSSPGKPAPAPGFLRSRELADLDEELRSDGHRLNPGTSADLVAASLFVHFYHSLPRKRYVPTLPR